MPNEASDNSNSSAQSAARLHGFKKAAPSEIAVSANERSVIIDMRSRYSPLVFALLACSCSRPSQAPSIRVSPARAVANGTAEIQVRYNPPAARFDIVSGRRSIEIETSHPGSATLRAGILPARIQLRVTASDGRAAQAELVTTLQDSDRLGDGTPDFLRLIAPDDEPFRRWFTFLAEAQYFRDRKSLPSEINDCAALIRYCYREALSRHSGEWANQLGLPLVPAMPSVHKYAYPYTPLHAALFRTRAGPFRAADLDNGAFAQFADAQSINHFNCRFISRDLARAVPGDLLFFKQLAEPSGMPFHSMIYLGPSQIQPSPRRYALYHTGPSGQASGEVRRLTVEQLIGYPSPQWRPVPGNQNFLGVYRWNILP